MKKRNSGVSFLELILTIAIASILSGVAIYSLNYTQNTNMKACVNNINSMLDRTRLVSMTKDPKPNFYIYKYHDKYYAKQDTSDLALDESGTVISGDGITIRGVVLGSPTVYWPVNGTQYLTVSFKRSTGGVVRTASPSLGESPGYDYIEILDSSGVVKYRIHLIGLTGKHYIEKF